MARYIRHLRWRIILLFAVASIISYIDRQTLSVNAPYIRKEFGLTATQYSYLVSAFLIAYTIGPTLTGRIIDGIGTRLGMATCAIWWSCAGALHAVARGSVGLMTFRFLLGLGAAGTLPSALRTVSEWFPRQERSLATSIFSTGTAIGAVVSVPVAAFLTLEFGWRFCFLLTGLLGFIWLVPWLFLYARPEEHHRLEPAEREKILTGRQVPSGPSGASISKLLLRRKPWGIILGRFIVDPVWWFYLFWLPTYLASRGLSLRAIGLLGWIPFLAADVGTLSGGWWSGWLLRRSGDLTRARKTVLLAGAAGSLFGLPVACTSTTWLSIALISVATFSIGVWGPTVLTLCADIMPSESVGTMAGLSGTGAGLGGIIFTVATGWLADHRSYGPVFALAGTLPLLGFIVLSAVIGRLEPLSE